MEGESNDLEKPNLHIEIEESRVELEVDNVTVDAGQLTEYRYENRIVCGQCSTVLLFGENVNNDGKCLNCERQENIVNERKRSRESLDKQAAKMLKLSNQKFSEVQVGTTVRVPIPDVDRARGSPRNVLAVVSDVNFKFF
ncbi:hypothetical protein QE152_g34919 [Popillia japonica]|uniref:Uncharacterized protein n=1 Tax=Popillia japonica TaxID=7064 RepID=A0AAW1IT33_POPJA